MNTTLTTHKNLSLEVRRVFPFPRPMVFEAWTGAEYLHRWMGPTPAIEAKYIEIDFREGGTYRFGFIEEGEPVKYVRGLYHMIQPPEKLVFSWTWEAPQIDAGTETLVTVEFNEVAQGTEVYLRHERFASREACELHKWGWEGTFDKLGARLPSATGKWSRGGDR
ncbi:MAG: SRPBCC domain-containing protein [Candidatus Thiodiazotropha sp. (ex Dulcina madagascariensis)]|nr:SRPBCC domain-containing protein [Candidatus Thiodiazotropha sp. (ex Dulcina madagascariensis)]